MPSCPDCDEPVPYTFTDTSGVGAWKQGDGFNTTPDSAHYVCFPCGKTWKQRLDGPLTPDIVGEIALFACREDGCGSSLTVSHESDTPTDVQLSCPSGHVHVVIPTEDGGLTVKSMCGG